MTRTRPRAVHVAALALALGTAGAGLVAATASAAPGDCGLTYTVTSSWPGGLQAAATVTNTSSREIRGWTAGFTLPAGQTVANLWNGAHTQAGQQVTVRNADYNGTLAPGASATFGLVVNASAGTGAATAPTCSGGGGTTPTPTPTATSTPTPTVTVPPTPTPTTPPTPTNPPTPTPTTEPPVPGEPHQANPFAGAQGYVNGDWASQVRAEADRTGGTLAAGMRVVGQQPTAVWMDRIAAIAGSDDALGLVGHLDAALAQQQRTNRRTVITVVVYNLPNRDCAALASNGELTVANNGLARYKAEYIDPIASILSRAKYRDLRIATVVEVDSLPNLVTNLSNPKCAEAQSSGAYVNGIRYALDKLAPIPNVYNYLDIAHSGWLGWDDNLARSTQLIADTIKGTARGAASVDGFVSATANYTPPVEPNLADPTLTVGGNPIRSAKFYEWNSMFDERDFGTAMRNAFIAQGLSPGIGMLIDTGRSGWGGPDRPTAASGTTADAYVNSGRVDRRLHRGNWCNQPGGVGERPRANPAPGFDAYVWIKPPGESDGASKEIPNDEGKRADPMCDPTFRGSQQANGGNLTGALPDAPIAGKFFPAALRLQVQNAYPSLGAGGAR